MLTLHCCSQINIKENRKEEGLKKRIKVNTAVLQDKLQNWHAPRLSATMVIYRYIADSVPCSSSVLKDSMETVSVQLNITLSIHEGNLWIEYCNKKIKSQLLVKLKCSRESCGRHLQKF